jgi:DNA repair exonuclease SbcCD ATPase subunit
MRITRMHLENFQGIKEFDLAPEGSNTSVFGDNGTGKSTIYNAFTWLMYGKASTDEKNYTPKTVDSHHLNHIVELTLMLDDGSKLTLKKDFHEVYKTKKGNADPVFAGHTSDYSIDGVPVSETEFSTRLKDLYKSEELAKMLTSYNYFLEEMKVKDRRQKLLELCGDVDFNTVIKSNEELAGFTAILKKKGDTDSLYTVEEYQAIAAKEKKLIDKKLREIPGRIDEVEKAKPDVGDESRSGLEAELEILSRKKAELELSKNAPVDSKIAEIKTKIANAKTAYAEAEAAYMRAESQKTESERSAIRELEKQADELDNEIKAAKRKRNERLENVRFMTETRERLLKEFKEASGLAWEGDGICPTCGQPLPEEQIDKAKEEFNIQKSKKLEDIQTRGKTVSKDSIAEEQKKADELADLIDEKTGDYAFKVAEISSRTKALKTPLPYKETESGMKLAADIEVLNKELEKAMSSSKDTDSSLDGDIAKVAAEIKATNEKLAAFALIEKQNARRIELEEEEKELAQSFEILTHGLYLCDLYSKTKAELLDEKVNSHFKTLRFRLFIEQQNGGIADDCEALIPCSGTYVPFKSANNAARINAGLEVLDALGDFYGVQLPIFIDNSEGCTAIRPTKAQQIRLYVSSKDKVLREENE